MKFEVKVGRPFIIVVVKENGFSLKKAVASILAVAVLGTALTLVGYGVATGNFEPAISLVHTVIEGMAKTATK